MNVWSEFKTLGDDLRSRWKLFLAIHFSANLFYLAVLGPALTLIIGWLIMASGSAALTDQDIARFFLSPTGLLVLVLGAAMLMSVLVFQSAALLIGIHRVRQGQPASIWRIGRYLLLRFQSLLRLAIHMVLRVLLLAAPFLALIAWLYFHYLGEFDINYYLSERPPVFSHLALFAGGLLLILALLLLRMASAWVLALPLLLLEDLAPREALRTSAERVSNRRLELFKVLLAWLAISALGFAVLAGLLSLGTSVVVAVAGASLKALAYLMGLLFLLWSAANFFLGFLAGTGLILLIYRLYEIWGEPGKVRQVQLDGLSQGEAPRVSGRVLLLLGVLITLLAGWVLQQQLKSLPQPQAPQIIAHRGASFDAPENTLAAVRAAIEQQADWIEIDVQETRAGEIVVIHDSDLMKVAGNPLKVFDASLAQLADIDIGSWKGPAFGAERVVTLGALLDVAKGKVKVIIELKYYGQETRLEERVAAIVEAHDMADDVVLMSLSLPGVQAMKALRPDWQVGLLSSVGLGDITRLEVDFFAVNASFASAAFVQKAHARGRMVFAWTVNDPALMSAMMSQGVDGMITDRPALAREVLAQRAALQPHELILVQLASKLGSDMEFSQ